MISLSTHKNFVKDLQKAKLSQTNREVIDFFSIRIKEIEVQFLDKISLQKNEFQKLKFLYFLNSQAC
ncbi:MAG: hypothetical protein KDK90_20860 [Leptospiraceae bacterium]|nr:hypothetical protein [Leptospiraceae bacterium]